MKINNPNTIDLSRCKEGDKLIFNIDDEDKKLENIGYISKTGTYLEPISKNSPIHYIRYDDGSLSMRDNEGKRLIDHGGFGDVIKVIKNKL